MEKDCITLYAKSIIAVAQGKPSTYFEEEIEFCKEIIKLLSTGNISQSSVKIANIFNRVKLKHEEEVPTQIANRIIELLSL